jgi:HrpA-like RNA helicase
MPLEGVLLQAKAMELARAASSIDGSDGDSRSKVTGEKESSFATQLLARCIDPPPVLRVVQAESLLVKLQALDSGQLTALGRLLADLPCDPSTGRLLIFGYVNV